MCDFISWIEKNGNIYYLTYRDIYHTTRGKELREYCKSEADLIGHGAIRFYYDNFVGGEEKECTDFSTTENFPSQIVSAVKKGQFRRLGLSSQLLIKPVWDEYDKVRQLGLDEYEKVRQLAMDECQKIQQLAWYEYDKVRQLGLDECQKIQQLAWSEYDKVQQLAWSEYDKVRQLAWSECQKVRQGLFWNIFAVKKNRNKLWR